MCGIKLAFTCFESAGLCAGGSGNNKGVNIKNKLPCYTGKPSFFKK